MKVFSGQFSLFRATPRRSMPWLRAHLAFLASVLIGIGLLVALATNTAVSAIAPELSHKVVVPFIMVGGVLLAFVIVVPWRLRQKRKAEAALLERFSPLVNPSRD